MGAGALPLNFLADPRAVGNGTKKCAYDAEFSTVLDAPGGSVSDPSDPAGSISDLFGLEGPVVQATVGARMTWLATGLNGRPVFSLDGGDYGVLAAFDGGAIAQPYTRIQVMKYGSVVSNSTSGDGGAAQNTGNLMMFGSPAKWQIYAGSFLASAVNADALLHVRVALFNGASSKQWLDNVEIASGAVGAAVPNGVTIGAYRGGSGFMPAGSLLALDAVYLGDIGAAARTFIQQAAVARFGAMGV